MSSYIHFFLRCGDKFLPIGTYGRSTHIYQAFEHFAPWERIRPVTIHFLDGVKNTLKDLDSLVSDITAARERIFQIGAFNNSIDEKLNAINSIEEEIAESKEEVEEIRNARNFIGFLYDILDEAEYSSAQLNANEYLYVGLECGGSVTVADIAS